MSDSPEIARVALPVPLRREFDYLAPAAGCPPIGARVRVPLGRRKLIGLVTAVTAHTTVASNRLRRIIDILDEAALLPEDLLRLCEWAARYYHHPPGEVFAVTLPSLLRRGAAATPQPESAWRITQAGAEQLAAGLQRAPRQRALLERVKNGPVREAELRGAMPRLGPVLKTLHQRGWIACENAAAVERSQPQPGPVLTDEQQQAIESVRAAGSGFHVSLLQGVTGSGKTEVYLTLAERILADDRQVLILVPEIGLTPQLVERFRQRLVQPIVLMHSGLTARERLDGWLAARDGRAGVVIGTRSAVFTPLARPGAIVVDEEHDPSYKQQDGLRYSARDVAVRRAQLCDIPAVLGSATPSLESLHNAESGRYRHVHLKQRAGAGAPPPRIELLDVRSRPLQEGLSEALIQRTRTHLDAGGQVLFFLNRRGYAPALICHDCGWIAPCQRCDAGLTLHKGGRRLRCHHCGADRPAPGVCENCNSQQLVAAGEGTERIAAALRARLPEAAIGRFDRDTTARKGSLEKQLAEVRSGKLRILVGTQMLAKGHDFPDLSLVCVVNADHGLYSVDFRALERMAQLVTQVAGRAGRSQRAGEVILQTRHPDHPLLNLLVQGGYSAFAEAALAERRAAGFPPYGYLALLQAESPHAQPPTRFLEAAAQAARATDVPGVQLWGPAPAPMERRAGRVRAQLLLHAGRRRDLHRLLARWVPTLGDLEAAGRVRWSLDVDPQDLI